jgi:hypothetical protein
MDQISESVRIGRHGENNWPGPYMGMGDGCAWLSRQRIFDHSVLAFTAARTRVRVKNMRRNKGLRFLRSKSAGTKSLHRMHTWAHFRRNLAAKALRLVIIRTGIV